MQSTRLLVFSKWPAKVFVNLTNAPYILRLHSDAEGEIQARLHDGQELPAPLRVAMNQDGQLLLGWESAFAALDDRDLQLLCRVLYQHQQPASDEAIADWLASAGQSGALSLRLRQQDYLLTYAESRDWFALYQFQATPEPA